MRTNHAPRSLKASLSLAASLTALSMAQAVAQDAVPEDEIDGTTDSALVEDVIIVTGIRRSLQASSEIKRDAQGVVDAITAEDIGKFPDTNLAESLQRITGVSIDRRNGEGSSVTVRGFGPQYNLVLLNGRQMPTAFLTGGAPTSRSFDFADLASEGISGVRVYKTGRAALPTGGIGSTLNILTARPLDAPGMQFTVGAKAVVDNSGTTLGDETTVSPDISGFFSNTFADGTFGVSVAGAYQERESGVSLFSTPNGWRGAYRGDENNWGTLPRDSDQVTNRPGDDDIYSVPQAVNYSLTQLERERINGQVSLQYRPIDTVTATLDYFYSQNKIDTDRSDMSVWFNHGDTTSAFGDGQIADILFYNEDFASTDLSMGTSRLATKSENHSVGFNTEWEATDNLSLVVDVHSSSAESGANSPFGSAGVVSTADLALNFQGVDFRPELPTLSLGWQDPFTDISQDRMLATGSTFQDSFIRTEIDQAQIVATYEFDDSIIESVDFGVAATRNDYRSTFSNNQRDSWGGVGSPEDFPDDIWRRVDLASNFDQYDGYQETFQDFFVVDFERLIGVLDAADAPLGPVCGGDGICTNDNPVADDLRTEEESYAAFFEVAAGFDIGRVPASVVGGLRYESTDVTSEGLSQVPLGTQWVAANELGFIVSDDPDDRQFVEAEGEYEFWLPSIDFQLEPDENWILRASYSHTLTRPAYNEISAGVQVAQLFRVDGGDASQGNTQLDPFLSQNFDLSAEWYYDEGSYLSVGHFRKKVDNFTARSVLTGVELFDGITTPIGGQRFEEAAEALGTTDSEQIRQFIFENADPSTFDITDLNGDGVINDADRDANGNLQGTIFGVPGEDPNVPFRVSSFVNVEDSRDLTGWEFAWQHFLGETGFGWILNYTIVDGDVEFNNLTVPSDPQLQTPLLGLSDSFNAVGFYDKNGLQVRAAYNWRDKFLNSAVGVSGVPNNPLYVEAYGQLDINASYDVTDNIFVFVEGINVLDNTRETVGRSDAYLNFAEQTGSRYNIGVRYRF